MPQVSADFVCFPNGFRRNLFAAVPVLLLAISSVFLRFFDEIRVGQSISEIFANFDGLVMLFGRNDMPTVHPPDFAISICFHIEIHQNG